MKVPAYNKDKRKSVKSYEPLPKGNYVCKILNIEEVQTKNGGTSIKIFFDIAEGDYKDFYANKYREDDREDKKWPADAVYWLTIPTDSSEAYIVDNWNSFWANVEDSNNGYKFDGNENTIKGKLFGGIFRIEESVYKGNTYSHTRLFRSAIAQDVRDGKVTWVPKDKMAPKAPDMSFIDVPEGAPSDLPF